MAFALRFPAGPHVSSGRAAGVARRPGLRQGSEFEFALNCRSWSWVTRAHGAMRENSYRSEMFGVALSEHGRAEG